MNDIFDEIKRITPAELEYAGVIARAKKDANGYHTYICPFCKNGEGDSGDGLTVTLKHWGYNFHCFGKCGGKNYTAVDLIKEIFSLTNMADVAEQAKELFKLSDDFSFSSVLKDFDFDNAEPMSGQEVKTPKDYSEFYKTTQSQLAEFIEDNGGKIRGLSLEDLQEVNAGIATRADLNAVGEGVPVGAKCLILPNEKSFLIRNVINTSDVKVSRVNKGGVKTIYNPFDVDFSKAVFVVEGEIDAISINKAGYQSVALCSVSMWGKFIEYLYSLNLADKSKTKIVLTLDNDKAGQNTADKLLTALKSAGYSAVNFILSQEFKDANEFLQKDFEGFKERLKEISRRADVEFAQIDSVRQKETYGIKLASYFKSSFRDAVNNSANFAERKTGFKNIDLVQILLPGLYVIGGLSALGKSSFAWQLLSQLAANGETCVYCSYEMSELEMFAKSFCRELYRRESEDYTREVYKPLTSADIRRGEFGDKILQVEEVISYFEESENDLRLLNLQNENIDVLLKKFEKICTNTDKPVTIAIDYLQIVPTAKENTKAGVDDIVRKLKVFQREHNITFIIISSLNRMSYTEPIQFSSFKESGSIEFSADVVWGLQLYFEDDTMRKSNVNVEKAKKDIPRKVELKCLKNRHGGNYICYFKYLPNVDTFLPCEESELKQSARRNAK